MSKAYQLAIGTNIPLIVNTPPAIVALGNSSFLSIPGGVDGDALTTDGQGRLTWRASGGGGGGGIPDAPDDGQFYGRFMQTWTTIAVDGVTIVGDGTTSAPFAVGAIDCGTF